MTNSSPPKFSPSTLFLPDPPLQLSWQMHVKKKRERKSVSVNDHQKHILWLGRSRFSPPGPRAEVTYLGQAGRGTERTAAAAARTDPLNERGKREIQLRRGKSGAKTRKSFFPCGCFCSAGCVEQAAATKKTSHSQKKGCEGEERMWWSWLRRSWSATGGMSV